MLHRTPATWFLPHGKDQIYCHYAHHEGFWTLSKLPIEFARQKDKNTVIHRWGSLQEGVIESVLRDTGKDNGYYFMLQHSCNFKCSITDLTILITLSTHCSARSILILPISTTVPYPENLISLFFAGEEQAQFFLYLTSWRPQIYLSLFQASQQCQYSYLLGVSTLCVPILRVWKVQSSKTLEWRTSSIWHARTRTCMHSLPQIMFYVNKHMFVFEVLTLIVIQV